MSLLVVLGLLGIILFLFYKNPVLERIEENNRLVYTLRKYKWFKNPWLSGGLIFVINAVLFLSTVLILYGLMYFFIPFVHLIVMFLAVIGSSFIWIVINKAWQGEPSERLKMGAIGSSFYLILTLIFIYWLVTLKPAYPGDDTFMSAIGLYFAVIVTVVAFVSCFILTGFSRKGIAK